VRSRKTERVQFSIISRGSPPPSGQRKTSCYA